MARCRDWLERHWQWLAMGALLPVALHVRLYALDWDRGLLFHPDERRILMVVESLAWPASPLALLSSESSLNPRFFAYGSLPLYLLRLGASLLASRWPEWNSYARFYLLGRVLSAGFDTLAVLATYLLAKRVFDRRVAVLSGALVAFCVLHIQLAHFYTVDTLLTLWVVLAVAKAVDVVRRGQRRDGMWLGLCLGAATATKVSVVPLFVVALLAWVLPGWEELASVTNRRERLRMALSQAIPGIRLTFVTALLTFLVLQPYALLDPYRFVVGIGQEIAMSQGWYDFPYTRQYIGTVPYLYPARQILLYAMGLPLGLVGMLGLGWLLVRLFKQRRAGLAVFLSWPVLYGLMQGAAHAKFVRYALPVLPFLSVCAAAWLVHIWDTAQISRRGWPDGILRPVSISLIALVVISTVWYAVAFLNVYQEPHSWIEASEWLCERAPAGSTILTEYWDDPLPVRASCGGLRDFRILQFDMYSPDLEGDSGPLLEAIVQSDYVVLSSQRLYAPIVRLGDRYPRASRYFQQLFSGALGFELMAAPAVYPSACGISLRHDPRAGLTLDVPPLVSARSLPGWVIDLGQADESFVVYDHPQPLVFERTRTLSRQQLQALLMPQSHIVQPVRAANACTSSGDMI